MLKSIRSRLVLSFAGIALVAAVVLGAVLLVILQNYYSGLELDYLRGNAESISIIVSKLTSANAPHDEVQSQIENLAFLSQSRIQVYGADQRLLYDSGPPQNVDVNLGVMKQIMAQTGSALSNSTFRVIGVNSNSAVSQVPDAPGLFGSESAAAAPGAKGGIVIYRSVQAVGSPFGFYLNGEAVPGGTRSSLTVAAPLRDPQNTNAIGSVKLSEGPAYGSDILTSVARGWVLASAIAVLLAAAVGWLISRRISAPVLALTDATARMAAGDLSSRANLKSQDEFGVLALSFNEMADQVEGTVTALRRFVSDAAHELQTPLTALRTNLDLTADESSGSDRRVYVERAQAMVKRLEELNNNLLDLSRLEANGHTEHESIVDLNELLKQSGEIYASQAEQAGLTLEYGLPGAPTPVRGDPVRVRRAVDNLVDNACKFTPAGGRIDIRLDTAGDRVLLSVADTGIGVPEEDLPQLFNRFHRGRNATALPGSGLGLAIVKAIMDQQGGQIAVENLAQGARFTLAWPSGE
jgi:signal transduction histidine kinase